MRSYRLEEAQHGPYDVDAKLNGVQGPEVVEQGTAVFSNLSAQLFPLARPREVS